MENLRGMIHLPNGEIEIIYNDNDFKKLVKEKLGDDAADRIQILQEESDYNNKKASTDLESYEMQLESNRDCFLELTDIIKELKEEVNKSRISKPILNSLLRRIETEISNQI